MIKINQDNLSDQQMLPDDDLSGETSWREWVDFSFIHYKLTIKSIQVTQDTARINIESD